MWKRNTNQKEELENGLNHYHHHRGFPSPFSLLFFPSHHWYHHSWNTSTRNHCDHHQHHQSLELSMGFQLYTKGKKTPRQGGLLPLLLTTNYNHSCSKRQRRGESHHICNSYLLAQRQGKGPSSPSRFSSRSFFLHTQAKVITTIVHYWRWFYVI